MGGLKRRVGLIYTNSVSTNAAFLRRAKPLASGPDANASPREPAARASRRRFGTHRFLCRYHFCGLVPTDQAADDRGEGEVSPQCLSSKKTSI